MGKRGIKTKAETVGILSPCWARFVGFGDPFCEPKGLDFGMLFCRIPERGVASWGRRRACDGSPGAADPP